MRIYLIEDKDDGSILGVMSDKRYKTVDDLRIALFRLGPSGYINYTVKESYVLDDVKDILFRLE